MSDENLWGKIPVIEKVETPLSILKKQALILGEMTNNLLEAEIKIHKNTPSQVLADLVIVAPTLGGYRIEIIRIQYELEIYPVTIINLRKGEQHIASDEGEFIACLAEYLQSDNIQNVIKALLIQVEQADTI